MININALNIASRKASTTACTVHGPTCERIHVGEEDITERIEELNAARLTQWNEGEE
jgi:hypothetical protein